MWLDSLENNELKKSKVLDVKKSIGVDKAK
jgi:hypothetical protein